MLNCIESSDNAQVQYDFQMTSKYFLVLFFVVPISLYQMGRNVLDVTTCSAILFSLVTEKSDGPSINHLGGRCADVTASVEVQ